MSKKNLFAKLYLAFSASYMNVYNIYQRKHFYPKHITA